MMKISKPVLMNDFAVSPVQFTSLNLINFKNIKPVYDGNEKILLEFEHPSKVEVSYRDWIGIFPRGWSTLQQYVTFEWIAQSVPNAGIETNKESGDVVKRTIAFCPKYHMNCVNQSAFYQFVYVGRQIEVLGVSSYFCFDLSCVNDSSLEVECLVPVSGKIRSTSVSDFGTISMTNEQSSTSIDSRKLMQTSSIHSLQNMEVDGKVNWSRINFSDDKKNVSLMKRTTTTTTLPTGNGDNLDPYSSHSEPVFPMSLPLTQCKKCYQFKRGGEILRSQQVLQSKLKIVMERNKVLEERTQEMNKEMERLQAESKRLRMSFYNINKEKIAYEKFVKDFIKSLEKDSIVRVMYGNTEILVKKVNYVGMGEHPRDKKTSKRERELKAVIGLQEITIRNLINSLQEKAKSVEELNQTVKLAQVFSAARTDAGRELGIDAEESADDVSNSDLTSEYEFSLSKPSPPEEVSGDADEVLDSIRRTSEMELKNIGITRTLGKNSESDLDVTNLSIITYEADNAVSKKPRLVDNVEDCWPFPRNSPKTLRQKLSGEELNLPDEKGKALDENGNVVNDASELEEEENDDDDEGSQATAISAKEEDQDATSKEERDAEFEMETSNCEDYYDAYDAFSVRSMSPEPEGFVASGGKDEDDPRTETNEEMEVESEEKGDDESERAEENAARTTVATDKKEEIGAEAKADEGGQIIKYTPPEKFNKFTCELSIDFGRRRQPSDGTAEDAKPEQGVVACRQGEVATRDPEAQVYSLERERSLITFKKSNKCFEIKITQVDQKETPTRSIHQKMLVQFVGGSPKEEAAPETEIAEGKDPAPEAEEPAQEANAEDAPGEARAGEAPAEGEERTCRSGELEELETVRDEEEEDEEEEGVEEGEEEAEEEEEKPAEDGRRQESEESMEVEAFSPRTEWSDANAELVESGVPDRGRYPESARPQDEDSTAEAQTIKEKMILQLEEKKSEITQQFLKSKCNIQMLTEDSINNLKIYQDSLRYEKNLQFLNNKLEDKGKESDDETLRDKPSAILIQSGQAKVALIRYQ